MSKKLTIDKRLILSLNKTIKANITDLAKKYCEVLNVEYTDTYRRTISKILSKEGLSITTTKIKETEEFKKAEKNKLDKNKKVFFCYLCSKQHPY